MTKSKNEFTISFKKLVNLKEPYAFAPQEKKKVFFVDMLTIQSEILLYQLLKKICITCQKQLFWHVMDDNDAL